jgi:Domain of unknown function (DUF4412)
MKAFKCPVLYIMTALLLVSSLTAGVYMNGTVKHSGKLSKMEMFAEKDRLRFQSNEDGGQQIFIYRGDLDKFWSVENGKYMEMTREDLKQMGAQMNDAMKMMNEKMEGLPEDQKKLIEQYMKGKMPDQSMGQAEKTTWKKVGSEKINNWECSKFESNDGQTAWTIDPEKVGLTKDDFQVFESVQEFFSEFMKDNDSFLKYAATNDSNGLSGFPVKSISSGEEHLINEITKKTLDSKLFELEKGWEKQDMPMMSPMK